MLYGFVREYAFLGVFNVILKI